MSVEESSHASLLEKTQKLIELERLLTISLEKVEPWLTSITTSSSFASCTTGTRVRPIPTNMDQVHAILSVARNLSTRTLAPAGWNPAAPVMGFSTPNPLPHQLRGGALGALELESLLSSSRRELLCYYFIDLRTSFSILLYISSRFSMQ